MICSALSPLNSKLLCYYKLPFTDRVCASRCMNWEAHGNVHFITSKQTFFFWFLAILELLLDMWLLRLREERYISS